MMKELKEIRDDQIRIIGEGGSKNSLPRNVWTVSYTHLYWRSKTDRGIISSRKESGYFIN